MQKYLFKNISVVNEGSTQVYDVFIKKGRIEKIDRNIEVKEKITEIQCEGKFLFPGVIDDQVHFREPGLTHKATIHSESRAAVAGGVTSFMEMPNTVPNALTQSLLEEKYIIAANNSIANYSFYMGCSNDNSEEVLRTNDKRKKVCGVKIFMGSSTGNMLVNNEQTLNRIFGESELLIATHCEDENTIKRNYETLKAQKKVLAAADHPIIRNTEACYLSSSFAVALAKKYGSRLHVLHISTAKEVGLFDNKPISQKRITAEVCVHHLHFSDMEYESLGYLIKCNPAIKTAADRKALWKGLLEGRLDVIATDHAPHTFEEKEGPYEHAHSGLPLVQHSLLMMLQHSKENPGFTIEKIAEKMSHAVADCFKIEERGYIREGYYADLVIVDMNKKTIVDKSSILYKCGWSPLEGKTFDAAITHTFVNGNCVWEDGKGVEGVNGQRLTFNV